MLQALDKKQGATIAKLLGVTPKRVYRAAATARERQNGDIPLLDMPRRKERYNAITASVGKEAFDFWVEHTRPSPQQNDIVGRRMKGDGHAPKKSPPPVLSLFLTLQIVLHNCKT